MHLNILRITVLVAALLLCPSLIMAEPVTDGKGACARQLNEMFDRIDSLEQSYLSQAASTKSIFKIDHSGTMVSRYINEVFTIDFGIRALPCKPVLIHNLRQAFSPPHLVLKEIADAMQHCRNSSTDSRMQYALDIAGAIYPKLYSTIDDVPYFRLSDLMPDGEEDDLRTCLRAVATTDVYSQEELFARLQEICSTAPRAMHLLQQMRELVLSVEAARLETLKAAIGNESLSTETVLLPSPLGPIKP